jgi:branched-chain amino acid transport system ATP-binding protein
MSGYRSLRLRLSPGQADAESKSTTATLPDSSACVEAINLDAWYGQAQALRNLSVSVKSGEIVGVLGRNGAGKSTLLRCLARLHRRVSGQMFLNGANILSATAEDVAIGGMGLVREGAIVFESLTVADHLDLAKMLARRRGKDVNVEEVADWFPIIWDRRNEHGGYLSGGQRQMLALAMGFLAQPLCLLLDEPSAGLAESVAESVYESIREICIGKNVALIIAEQDGRWLEGLANRAYVLDNGTNAGEKDGSHLDDADVGWT